MLSNIFEANAIPRVLGYISASWGGIWRDLVYLSPLWFQPPPSPYIVRPLADCVPYVRLLILQIIFDLTELKAKCTVVIIS
jgi:hypothetical protein